MLKIVSWNIRHAEGKDGVIDIQRIAKSLKDLKADIYTIQEIDIMSPRTGKIDQAKAIADELGMKQYFTPISDISKSQYGPWYGLCTYTNIPVKEKKDIRLIRSKDNHSAQHIVLNYKDKNINLVHLHAHWRLLKSYWENFYKLVPSNMQLLIGDFNLQPNTGVISSLKEMYNSINESATYEDGTVIDYTFSSFPIISQEVIPTDLSDHNILVTTVNC